jgi:hypothetical protein
MADSLDEVFVLGLGADQRPAPRVVHVIVDGMDEERRVDVAGLDKSPEDDQAATADEVGLGVGESQVAGGRRNRSRVAGRQRLPRHDQGAKRTAVEQGVSPQLHTEAAPDRDDVRDGLELTRFDGQGR